MALPSAAANPGPCPENSESQFSCELASGGFSSDTEVLSASGPIQVTALSVGDLVYAFDPITKLARLKPVIDIQQVSHDGPLVALETRRSDLKVSPDHRILFSTEGCDDLRVQPACNLDAREYYKFVNDWQTLSRECFGEVDITDFIDDYEICAATDRHGHTIRAELPDECEPSRRNSHIGYYFDPATFKEFQADIESVAEDVSIHAGPNHHRRPYRFDGDDFIQFLGWFITEGSIHWSTSSDTAQVKIAQETETHRSTIQSLLERMGLTGSENARRFEFASKIFGQLLQSLCGAGSRKKRLPEFIWTVSCDQQALLLNTLLSGDGNERGTYYTSSDHLAFDVCRLCVEVGMKPRYTRSRGEWQIGIREVNDGFRYSKNIQSVGSTGDLYRLTVADYSTVMAGRNGKFQWTGVSCVA